MNSNYSFKPGLIEEKTKRLAPDERKELKDIKKTKDKLDKLDIPPGKKIILEKDKERQIIIPSPESKLLQYILKDELKFKQYRNSYAYRNGKGHIKAMKKANKKLQTGDYSYCLKLDIKDFFPSINHSKLLEKLQPKWRKAVKEIVESRYIEDDTIKKNIEGLPLGNPLSGTLSNLYLSEFDRKVFLLCDHYKMFYIRYSDDILILSKKKQKLVRAEDYMKERLDKLELQFNKQKRRQVKLEEQEFSFLGYSLKKDGKILVKDSTRENILKGVEKAVFKNNRDFQDTVAGYRGTTIHSKDVLHNLFN